MNIPRINSIDLLKVVALLLVINSHMQDLYGEMGALATGGAIGDAFFFFAAGYLMERKYQVELLKERPTGFFAFLGNRIWRIYPTVWMWAAVLCLLLGVKFRPLLLVDGNCWFIGCIMAYFMLLWFIQHFLSKHKVMLMGAIYALSIVLFFSNDAWSSISIYGLNSLKYIFYFLPMLMGSWLAEGDAAAVAKGMKVPKKKFSNLLCLGLLSVIVYYVLAAFKFSESLAFIQLFSIPALLAVTFFAWQICNTDLLLSFANNGVVRWLSGIGLESYVIQWSIIALCYQFDADYGWIWAWLLLLLLASIFHILVQWVRLVFNYLFD